MEQRVATGELTLEFTEDPARFLDAAAAYLTADPLLATVVTSVSHRALDGDRAGQPRPDHPQWWVTVRDGTQVVGVAMRTAPFPPYPMFVLPMADAAARAIARSVHERGEVLGAVNGVLPAIRALAEESARLAGGRVEVHEHTRLFELGTLVQPGPVPGRLRRAGVDDLAPCLRWFMAFHADAAEQAGRRGDAEPAYITEDDVRTRVESGRVWLWEDETGQVVHLTGRTEPSFGVARIGPVFTPREQRGRGFASATVAAVAADLLAEGVRVCLFTDQANPTSNKIYQALGFEPVTDMANLLVGP